MKRSHLNLLAAVVMLAACSAEGAATPTVRPSPSPTGAQLVASPPPIAASASPTIPTGSTPIPSLSADPIGTLRIPLADRSMVVTIVGQPGVVVAWRAATEQEMGTIDGSSGLFLGLARVSDRQLVLGWIGTICDVEATLTIAPRSLVIQPVPRQACDAMAVGRGIVLTYASPIAPTAVDARLENTVLLPEPGPTA